MNYTFHTVINTYKCQVTSNAAWQRKCRMHYCHWSWGCTTNYEASFEEQSQRERKREKSMRENGRKSTEKYMSEKGKALGKCGKNRGKQAKKATLRSNSAQRLSANVHRQILFLNDPLLCWNQTASTIWFQFISFILLLILSCSPPFLIFPPLYPSLFCSFPGPNYFIFCESKEVWLDSIWVHSAKSVYLFLFRSQEVHAGSFSAADYRTVMEASGRPWSHCCWSALPLELVNWNIHTSSCRCPCLLQGS